jgi:hypothetical protein
LFLHSLKRSTWTPLQRGGAAEIAAAAQALVARGTLVSFFECRSCAEVELVAVALAATRDSGHFDFIAVTREDIDALGVPAARSVGVTPLPAANDLHWDLDLANDRARRLVEHLRARGARAGRLRKEDLRASAQKLRNAGHPVPSDSWLLR